MERIKVLEVYEVMEELFNNNYTDEEIMSKWNSYYTEKEKNFFIIRETTETNYFILVPNLKPNKNQVPFPYRTKTSSYDVAAARVLGVEYHELIRFLMYSFPNEVLVKGKGSYYPIVYWRKGQGLTYFQKLLNDTLNTILVDDFLMRLSKYRYKMEAEKGEDKNDLTDNTETL